MTTVFCMDDKMFSDGRITADGEILSEEQPKVFKWEQWLIGIAGNAEFVIEVANTKFPKDKNLTLEKIRLKLRKLFADNIEYDHKESDDLCHVLLYDTLEEKMYISLDSPKLNFIKLCKTKYAIGSGSQAARALMENNIMDAKQILDIVSKVDPNSNNILYAVS